MIVVKSWTKFVSNLAKSKKTVRESDIQYHSAAVNVYHCCAHKTASQWIRKILSDPCVYRYSGLKSYHYQSELYGGRDSRALKNRVFAKPFPTGTIISPLYVSFDNFQTIPKPERYKAFFVERDPKDILVSWYFSIRYSHTLSDNIARHRQVLNTMSFDDGMMYAMDRLQHSGHFQLLASWINASKRDANVRVVRFEELTGPESNNVFTALFEHCDISMPRDVLHQLLTKYSFEALSGRKPGEEKKDSHYRKGISGDWKNYLSEPLIKRFEELSNGPGSPPGTIKLDN